MARYHSRIGVTTGAASSETRQRLILLRVVRRPAGTAGRSIYALDGCPRRGQNLQQAGTVISFDLPWNPMRLVQRLVASTGSDRRDIVHLYVFDQELDRLLDLQPTCGGRSPRRTPRSSRDSRDPAMTPSSGIR
jgi:hypothetical protein